MATAALAGGGGGHDAPAQGPSGSFGVVVVLAMVGGAYLLAHFVVNRLQRRFLFVSGMEYILLGVLLGPAVVNAVQVFEDMSRLAPIIAFAAGWIGLLYGMELDRRKMHESSGGAVRAALADVGGAGVVTTFASYAFFRSGLLIDVVPRDEALCAAGALGCAAAAGSSSAVDLLSGTYEGLRHRGLLPLLRRTSRIGDLLAIAALGLLFAYFHPGASKAALLQTDFAGWVLITGLLGLMMGFLFSAFLDNDADENHRFLALVGIIVLTAGTAFFLEISALTVNLILGVYLVNSDDGPQVAQTLETSLKPVTLVLMVFAGAMWVPVDPLAGLVISIGYLALRAAAKAGAGFLVALGTPLRKDLFRGLMAQGEAAVAIAVSYRLVFDGEAAELAYTAILTSVMLNELLASRLLKGLLIDAGELDSDAEAWEARA